MLIRMNEKYKTIHCRTGSYMQLSILANFNPFFVKRMTYFNPITGSCGAVGPADLIKLRDGMELTIT